MQPVPRSQFSIVASRGDLVARHATREDMAEILALRALAFRGDPFANDADAFDALSDHLWIGVPGSAPLGTLRLRLHRGRETLATGYTGQYYDLSDFALTAGPVLEIGRLCTRPGARNGEVLRLVWTSISQLITDLAVGRLIGCTSFRTTDPSMIRDALTLLAQGHMAPAGSPAVLLPHSLAYRDYAAGTVVKADALAQMPSLLRCYLRLGGWVSDRLVIDRDLGTSHVFTCVEVADMPRERRDSMRRMAQPA